MGVYSQRVQAGADDGYWAGAWDNTPTSNGIGKSFLGGDNYSAWRFNNVTINQGTTITSAYLKIKADETKSDNITFYIKGIDEDDTANFSSDPISRSTTSAQVSWNINGQTAETEYTSPDIKTVIQEIIDRGGWSNGNDLGLITVDNGTSNDKIGRFYSYDGSTTKCALLEINYSGSSPSASVSPSSSVSLSPSVSISRSPSQSTSPSPSQMDEFFGLRIIKPEAVAIGKNVFNTQEPFHYIFNSDYGTLKYYEKQSTSLSLDAGAGNNAITGTLTHDLGYYPFVEVFVSVYITTPTGIYQYCPFAGAGASVFYSANYKITTTGITLYGDINGVSSSVWTFDFLVFIYKNNLNL